MKTIIALFALLAVVGCASTAPKACPERLNLSYWENYWGIALDDPMPAALRDRFVKQYNAHPPQSDLTAEAVYIVVLGREAVVILHDGDCITHINPYEKRLVDFWLSKTKGI